MQVALPDQIGKEASEWPTRRPTHPLYAHAILGMKPAAEWVLAALTHVAMIVGLQNLPG